MPKKSPFLVTTDWLHSNLDDPTLAIVDASWYLPADNRDGRAEFEAQRIPGAVFFDIDAISEPGSKLPHTLASPEFFAEEVGKLGISEDSTIVVYDGMGLFSAARVWWNFRIMGAKNVFILDGGFPEWLKKRLPTGSGIPQVPTKTFTPNYNPDTVVSFDEMREIAKSGTAKIADARPNGRFTGEDAEPRPGMRSGHMPGAKNIPVAAVVEQGKLLPLDDIRSVLEKNEISADETVVTTCGSGVTAAIISLALESVGHSNSRLYDGSWSEWGGRKDTDIETG